MTPAPASVAPLALSQGRRRRPREYTMLVYDDRDGLVRLAFASREKRDAVYAEIMGYCTSVELVTREDRDA